MSRRDRGALAEEAAARYLESQGYMLRARNFELRIGEIDLIAEQGDDIAFVEVKARRNTDLALPREQVNERKQRQIARTAVGFVCSNNIRNKNFRFDIIEVYLDHHGEPAKIEHLVHAFDLPRGIFI